jgi:anaerobic magnesium-protoporphyrin IX monomethyl ester cyclase
MNCLFGQSYYLIFDPKLYDAMKPYPPLGTLYAAAVLRRAGYDVAVFDAMLAQSEAEWAVALDQHQPQIAIIYEDNFNYLSKMCLGRMRQAALTMIEMAKKRGCTVIVCGSDATDHPHIFLDGGADYILLGEGEETLIDLMACLSGNTDAPPESIIGVQSKHSLMPTRRPVMRDLDTLPMPAWDLINIALYKEIWLARHGYFSMNLVTTRGCPYHCNWCAKPIWGQRYHVHSPQTIVAQMKHLRDTYGVHHIWFADDIMGLKPNWIETFADLLTAAGLKIPFKCLSRADLLVRGDTINSLARAGCEIVWIGAESGSQRILDAMEKGTTIAQIREAASRLQAVGVGVAFFLQFGYPGETRAELEMTLNLVRDCMPDDIGMSVSYPLPGTKFYDRVKNQLGEQDHWHHSDDLAMLYAGPFSTAFYRQLHITLHKEFRARKTWRKLIGKAPPTHLLDDKPLTIRDVLGMLYHLLTLPWAWRTLKRLESAPHVGIGAIAGGMDYASASVPSPQDYSP